MNRERASSRGMFGYEGEGFDVLEQAPGRVTTRDFSDAAARGWNVGSDSDDASTPEERTDERIREDVRERLMTIRNVDANAVDVEVAEGVVTLSGSVPGDHASRAVEDLCNLVRGVKDVRNHLRVGQ